MTARQRTFVDPCQFSSISMGLFPTYFLPPTIPSHTTGSSTLQQPTFCPSPQTPYLHLSTLLIASPEACPTSQAGNKHNELPLFSRDSVQPTLQYSNRKSRMRPSSGAARDGEEEEDLTVLFPFPLSRVCRPPRPIRSPPPRVPALGRMGAACASSCACRGGPVCRGRDVFWGVRAVRWGCVMLISIWFLMLLRVRAR
ncbi:hypothetical protein F4779DRAFT_352611 [Xylariaceae sp. FL0662B]|nr:hypothetical protein F4779DRAFT_352611 [Xylariaceae sp. FL0662B]